MDRSWLGLPAGALLALGALTVVPVPADQAAMLAVTLFSVALWVTMPVPPWFTGLLCVGAVGLVLGPSLALTGFDSPALWLIVFGLVVGAATRESGLAGMFERAVLARAPTEGPDATLRTYRYLLVALSAGGLALTLVVPSALVRVLVLSPVVVSVGEAFESRAARLGIFFAPVFATFYGAAGVLTAAVPNIVITGIAESIADVSFGWSEWLVALFPLMGVARVALVVAVVYALYRPRPDETVTLPDPADIDTRSGYRMLAYLLVGGVIWATDAVHGLHPLFGALVVAALAVLPRVGVIEFDEVGDIDLTIVFFVGAVFAIAAGLAETGFTDRAAGTLLAVVPADAPLWLTLAGVFFVTLALTVVVEGAAVASVLTPVLVSYAAETGVALEPVLYVEAVALAHYFFPYQSMVLVVALDQEPVEPRELVRVASALSVATIVLLLPPQVLWLAG